MNSFIRILDDEGNLVFQGDNSDTSRGAGGSSSTNDTFLDVELEKAGTYFIEVGRSGGDGALGNNDRYELHVSLENHRLQTVLESDPRDYYRIDLKEGGLVTLACYQGEPLMEVFENGNPLSVQWGSRSDLFQMLSYRADSDVSLTVKFSNELVIPYDFLVLLDAEVEEVAHSTPSLAMNVSAGKPTLAWIADDLADFYRVSFSEGEVRNVSVSQLNPGGSGTLMGIAIYNLSQELVMTSTPTLAGEISVAIPEGLGDDFYIAVTRGEDLPSLYLLQVGEAATDCREVLPSGAFPVEWAVLPNQEYQVEFSPNVRDWTLIPEVVSSPNALLQWVDSGPPRTNFAPGVERGNRYYRLVIRAE